MSFELKISIQFQNLTPKSRFSGFQISCQCFVISKNRQPWQTGSELCRRRGGNLLSPFHSSNELQKIINTFREQSLTMVWLGLRRDNKTSDFQTESGRRIANLKSEKWFETYPQLGSGNCVSSFTGGKWINSDCQEQRRFICEL